MKSIKSLTLIPFETFFVLLLCWQSSLHFYCMKSCEKPLGLLSGHFTNRIQQSFWTCFSGDVKLILRNLSTCKKFCFRGIILTEFNVFSNMFLQCLLLRKNLHDLLCLQKHEKILFLPLTKLNVSLTMVLFDNMTPMQKYLELVCVWHSKNISSN